MKEPMNKLNKLLQEKWKVRFDDYEFIEPYLDIIKNDDITKYMKNKAVTKLSTKKEFTMQKKHKTIKSTKYVIKDYPLLYPYFWSSREEPIKASNIVYKIINEERVDCFGFLVREFGIKELEKFYKKEFLAQNERRELFEMFISYWR